jgi:uncharacterized protein
MERVAIKTYLLKVAAYCNLNCSYCYMFNLKDKSFLGKSKLMSLDTVRTAAARIVELAVEQGMSEINVSFHGGEPLLAGKEWFRDATAIFRQAGEGKVTFKLGLQTNAVLIDAEWVEFLEQNQIAVGVSMDGPRHVNDRARVNFAGASSHDATVAGIQLMLGRPIFGGILSVMNPADDGLEIYKYFLELGVKSIDFLWPLDHNWDAPPASLSQENATPYADYLIPIFDEWFRNDSKRVSIRYFDRIIRGLFGASVKLDALGGNPINIVTIDTDGSIEPVDSLRASADGLTSLGLYIQKDPLAALYEKEAFQVALAGRKGLSEQCLKCPFMDTCGGGYLPHRYSSGNGFRNPSVYCRDLWKLINHITDTVVAEMSKSPPVHQAAEVASTLERRG